MKRFGQIILKNAAANVMRGAATAVVALALPHFLTRALSPDAYSAWSLMIQIAAIASYLDFGLQSAVARHVAQLAECGEDARLNSLMNTAVAMLAGAAGLALFAMIVLLWQVPFLMHGIPPALVHEFRIAAALLSLATCAQLPLSAFTGLLIGLHRNEYPALAIGGSRMVGAVAAIAAGYATHSLIVLAVCVGVANLMGGWAQMIAAHRLMNSLRLNLLVADWKTAAGLARYCAGLTVFSFGVFLVNGIDLAVVGHFQFEAVGYYSVATALITCYIGLGAAVINALMTPMAALFARGDLERIRATVLLATRWTVAANAFLIALVFVYGEPMLTVWVGSFYARPAFLIFRVLIVAQAIRLVGGTFGVMLVATGQQRHGTEGAAVEGVVSLLASLAGAAWLGPIGVALGTLAGTVTGLLWILARTMLHAQAVPLARRDFLIEGVLRPLLCCIPLACCLLTPQAKQHQTLLWIAPLFLAVSGYIALRFGNLFSGSGRYRDLGDSVAGVTHLMPARPTGATAAYIARKAER